MIIGISGHAGAGKNTCARILSDLVGAENFAEIAFAEPMKRFCREVFDFSEEQLYGSLKETEDKRYPRVQTDATGSAFRTFLTPRYALQRLGTEFGRDCYVNIWVEYGIRCALELAKTRRVVAITDCRFLNEADAIREAGGVVWNIHRPGKDGAVGVAGHASETEMATIKPDLIVENVGTLEELALKVGAAWEWSLDMTEEDSPVDPIAAALAAEHP